MASNLVKKTLKAKRTVTPKEALLARIKAAKFRKYAIEEKGSLIVKRISKFPQQKLSDEFENFRIKASKARINFLHGREAKAGIVESVCPALVRKDPKKAFNDVANAAKVPELNPRTLLTNSTTKSA